jgi:hypothetical protein
MEELVKLVKVKFTDFNITPQHLGKVIRDNNKTRKRTRHAHFPKERYKKPIEKENEMNKFFTVQTIKIFLSIMNIDCDYCTQKACALAFR